MRSLSLFSFEALAYLRNLPSFSRIRSDSGKHRVCEMRHRSTRLCYSLLPSVHEERPLERKTLEYDSALCFCQGRVVINPLTARSRHCGRRIPCFLAVASPNCRISLPRRYRAGKLTLPDQISLSGCLALPSQCALFALRYVPLKVRGSSEIHVCCSHTIVDLVLLSPRRSAQSFRSGDCIGTPWREYQIPRTHIIALLELDDSLLLSGRKPSVVFSNTRQ